MKMNRRALLKWGKEMLEARGIPDPRAEAELLFLSPGGIGRAELYRDPEALVPAAEEERYRELIRRREGREPLFYLLGEREFWSLPIRVARGVFIPRPETELLVEEAIKIAKSRELRDEREGKNSQSKIQSPNPSSLSSSPAAFTFLDLGTGSGAISLAILTEIPEARGWAGDLSPAALRIAAGNAVRLRLADRIHFFAGDLLAPVKPDRGGFDLVVCNPPYIPSAVIPSLAPEVAEGEPRLALDGGEDGLRVIRRVTAEAWPHLKAAGFLLIEIGYDQAEAVRDILNRHGGYRDIRVAKDYSGKDRVAVAKKRGL